MSADQLEFSTLKKLHEKLKNHKGSRSSQPGLKSQATRRQTGGADGSLPWEFYNPSSDSILNTQSIDGSLVNPASFQMGGAKGQKGKKQSQSGGCGLNWSPDDHDWNNGMPKSLHQSGGCGCQSQKPMIQYGGEKFSREEVIDSVSKVTGDDPNAISDSINTLFDDQNSFDERDLEEVLGLHLDTSNIQLGGEYTSDSNSDRDSDSNSDSDSDSNSDLEVHNQSGGVYTRGEILKTITDTTGADPEEINHIINSLYGNELNLNDDALEQVLQVYTQLAEPHNDEQQGGSTSMPLEWYNGEQYGGSNPMPIQWYNPNPDMTQNYIMDGPSGNLVGGSRQKSKRNK